MIRKQDIIKELVINIGLLDEEKIKKALLEQAETKAYFAGVLAKLGYVSNQNVGKTIAAQTGILPVPLDPKNIEKKLLNLLPSNIALAHRVLPLKQKSGALVIGTDDPLNFIAEKNLEGIIGLPVELELVKSKDFETALNELYSAKEKSGVDLEKASEGIKDTKGGDDAPIVKLVNVIIGEAVKKRASDIHVEPLENKFRVRYRIDGVLHNVPAPPKRLQGSILSRIKIMAGMDIAEKRLPQDGRIKIALDKKELDLRVSSLPGIHGESIVMRILDKSSFLVGLEDLGFLPEERKEFEKLISMPNGMILVTGPTGSGKTTTLYTTLSHINQKERKIITIEDPVEYQLDGINQVQVKPQIGLTFAGGLRSMLRQAPDIIMVGEIRDLETAQIAIQSALTGHLIFSTLHTNDAVSAIARLVDMGIKNYLVVSTVQGILAQRLVRTLCSSCREAYKPTEGEIRILSLTPEEESGLELYRSKGCPSCGDTGFKGRVGIYELFIMTDEIREMILDNASNSEVLKKARQAGMKTLKEDGIEKVKRGYTTVQEVMRVTQDV
ncbi:MAG: type II secretion system ATPase GspE [Candidatus Omnitrophica bacterium]|nr:type II secretion system ATPase GspE [Candidatus Omnitrophota bacterium]MBU1933326.1 type II secretion system ATPase GspE [Candidatus Omnitrophota bacterium]